MTGNDLLERMDLIDFKYVEEADEESDNKKSRKWNKGLILVAGICLMITSSLIFFKIVKPFGEKTQKSPLSVSAEELGKTEIQFGATMPDFLYADSDRVVMYDYVGIWEYNLNEKTLTGFCDFRPINMTQIQGYPCVFVEMSANGSEVRFYMSDGTKKYLYNLARNEYWEVADYDTSEDAYSRMKNVTEEKSLSDCSSTYQMEDGRYISYILDWEYTGEDDPPKYGDLRLVIEDDGELEYYTIFQ